MMKQATARWYIGGKRPPGRVQLDRTVLAAYDATDHAAGWDPMWADPFTETGAGQPHSDGHELTAHRDEVERLILGHC